MLKLPAITDLSTYFYQGKYNDILDSIGRSPIPLNQVGVESYSTFQVGSMVFLGEFQEAKIIYERIENAIETSLLFKTQCRFFLGIGCVRRSDYGGAARYFSHNLKELNKKYFLNITTEEKNEIIFYSYQGSAFFRFFKGQFIKAKTLSSLAYTAAFENQFIYGQILSLDLLGHSLCLLGYVRRGIYELDRALTLAKKLGNGGVVTALNVYLVRFRAHFGLDQFNSVEILTHAIHSLSINDTYSRAELYLELIRQLILRGRGTEAQKQLEAVGNIIYVHENKRQTAFFNLRCAQLFLLKGEIYAALALIVSLRNNLNSKVDIYILSLVDELENKIKIKMNNSEHVLPLETRDQIFVVNSINLGEDLMGDILDRAQIGTIKDYYEIKGLGLFGLLPQILGIPSGFSVIYIGPSRGELVIVNAANVICVDKGVTGPLKKLLILLDGKEYKSKDFLVSEVWNYHYNPLLHDNLLHASIGKLRNILGEFATWIEWSNEGYRLTGQVKIVKAKETEHTFNQKKETLLNPIIVDKFCGADETNAITPMIKQNSLELNIRQLKLIKTLKTGEFVGVSDYAKRFRICNMTACRDLSSLHNKGLMLRIGKGRATVYGVR